MERWWYFQRVVAFLESRAAFRTIQGLGRTAPSLLFDLWLGRCLRETAVPSSLGMQGCLLLVSPFIWNEARVTGLHHGGRKKREGARQDLPRGSSMPGIALDLGGIQNPWVHPSQASRQPSKATGAGVCSLRLKEDDGGGGGDDDDDLRRGSCGSTLSVPQQQHDLGSRFSSVPPVPSVPRPSPSPSPARSSKFRTGGTRNTGTLPTPAPSTLASTSPSGSS